MSYNPRLDLLAVGAESTPGTPVTPTSATRFRNIKFSAEMPMEGDNVAAGDFGQSEQYVQELVANIEMQTYLSLPPALDTAPDWSPMAVMSGWRRTAHTTVGQSWSLRSLGSVAPHTMWALLKEDSATPGQLNMRAKGCMGNLKIAATKSRDVIKMDVAAKGGYYGNADIASGSIITQGTVNTTDGMQLSGWSVALQSFAARLNSFEIDSGAEIAFLPDQGDANGTGLLYFSVRNVAPTIKLGIELPSVASFDYYTRTVARTIGSMILSNQGSGASLFQIRAPRVQLVGNPELVSLNGYHFLNLTLRPLRNGSSDATMNADDMIELLHGAKT